MKDQDKTREQLINELAESRQRVAELEAADTGCKPAEVLRALTSRYEAILAAVPDIIMEVDTNKVYTWTNQAGFEFFGEDVLGKEAAFYFEGEQDTYGIVQPLFSGDENVIYLESWQRRKDGEKRLLAWWCRVLKDANGNVTGALSTARDITQRRRAEEELHRLNRALRMISECNQVLIRTTEEVELLQEICRIITQVGGYRLAWVGFAEQDEEKTVCPVAQVGFEDGYLEKVNITWADAERGRGPTGTAIRIGEPAIARYILTDPNLEPWRVEVLKRGYASSIALPLIANGQTLGALNIYAVEPDAFDAEEVKLLAELANDLAYGIVTLRTRAERKQAEGALRESEERFRSLTDDVLNSSAVGVFILDPDFRIVWLNQALERYFSIRSDEIVGKDKRQLIHERIADIFQDPENFAEKVLATYDDNTYIENFECHVLPDGEREERWLEHWSQPIRSGLYAGGRIEHYYDITERKRAEEALREHVRQIERLNDLFVGREQRMIELKREVNSLLKKLGQTTKYEVPAEVDKLRKELEEKPGQ
jgi:PAS domain S-box-containing protein